ncbi:unnamed protein product [Sphagnum jensenii]|uniref:Uncharacterized protein n=1 Tax=Sphagnum jensenii TaxID=128206 RepID=A0ABP0W8I5_9BRYO
MGQIDLAIQGFHCCQSQASIIPYLLEFENNSCTPFHATGKQSQEVTTSSYVTCLPYLLSRLVTSKPSPQPMLQ